MSDGERIIKALRDGWSFGPIKKSPRKTSRHSMWVGRPSEGDNWHCVKVDGSIKNDWIKALLDSEGVPE